MLVKIKTVKRYNPNFWNRLFGAKPYYYYDSDPLVEFNPDYVKMVKHFTERNNDNGWSDLVHVYMGDWGIWFTAELEEFNKATKFRVIK